MVSDGPERCSGVGDPLLKVALPGDYGTGFPKHPEADDRTQYTWKVSEKSVLVKLLLRHPLA